MKRMESKTDIVRATDRILGGAGVDPLLERGSSKLRPIKLEPATLAMGLLALGSGVVFWDKIEKMLSGLFVKFMRSAEYRTVFDQKLHETMDRVAAIIRPKLYPIIGELQGEYKRGDFANMPPAQFEKHLRGKVAAKLAPSDGEVNAAFIEYAKDLKMLILSNVIEDLIDFIYKETFHG